MIVHSELWGRPGLDCGGFCRFCFYKNVDFNRLQPTGCVNCPPDQIGCQHCQEFVNRIKNDFKPLPDFYFDFKKKLWQMELWGLLDHDDPEIVVTSGADIFFYPHLFQLISIIKEDNYHLHFSYTSGKAIKNGMAEKLISQGVDEVSFSVFSTEPELRRKWMNDRSPEQSINGLKLFCENIDLNASAVVIPGVNDEEQIFNTCTDLENWGVKSFSLRRFANFKNQGLIFNKERIMNEVETQSYLNFQELVRKVSDEFSFKVLSFPFYDNKKDFPFAISKNKNKSYLKELPPVKSEATILTSKLAGAFIKKIFSKIDDKNLVNIISLDKEVADLITKEDLEAVDPSQLKQKIIIPRGALVHDKQAEKTLSRDGTSRKILRGPKLLTHPYYESIEFSQTELINYELRSFKELIEVINQSIEII